MAVIGTGELFRHSFLAAKFVHGIYFFGGSSRMKAQETSAVWPLS